MTKRIIKMSLWIACKSFRFILKDMYFDISVEQTKFKSLPRGTIFCFVFHTFLLDKMALLILIDINNVCCQHKPVAYKANSNTLNI